MIQVPTNFLTLLYNKKPSIKFYSFGNNSNQPNKLVEKKIFLKSKKSKFFIERSFLLWLSGFVDAEGNFNISLRNLDEVGLKYNSLLLTFQIGLHIKDLSILKVIQQKLHCGHISISNDRCNYFINDHDSLINIIVPIFEFVNLNSSKKFHFKIFKQAVNLLINKKHLTIQGKLAIIKLFFKMKEPVVSKSEGIIITDQWFAGFVDGDGCFSFTSSTGPRFKLENHIKEYELYIKIKEYLDNKSNNNFSNSIVINIFKARANRENSNPVCVIDIHNIHLLKNLIMPIFKVRDNITGLMIYSLKTKKLQDFNDWCILVYIFYYGYNRLSESISIINEIRLSWNNFRLQNLTLTSTYSANFTNLLFSNSVRPLPKGRVGRREKEVEESREQDCFKNQATQEFADELKDLLNIAGISRGIEFKDKLSCLFAIPSPYIIKNSVRFLRGSNSLVSEKRDIYCINVLTNEILKFSSLTACEKSLAINRSTIKKYLISGQIYNNYRFTFFVAA